MRRMQILTFALTDNDTGKIIKISEITKENVLEIIYEKFDTNKENVVNCVLNKFNNTVTCYFKKDVKQIP